MGRLGWDLLDMATMSEGCSGGERKPVAAVAGILLSDGAHLPKARSLTPVASATHVLLVRRKGRDAGKWCIPCGYVEYEEAITDAVVREMAEETSLRVEPMSVYAVHSNFHDPQCHTVGVWFIVRYVEGDLRAGDDAAEVLFFPLTDPPELAFPTDRIVIEALLAGAEQSF